MSPKIVDKELKRESILRAAMKVFAQQGVNDFKMIQIAEAAGVGKGTIYEYFPSKEALVIGSIALFFDDFARFVEQRSQADADPAEQIRTLVAAVCEFYIGQKDRLETIFHIWGAGVADPRRKEFIAEMNESYRETRDHLATGIEVGVQQGLFKLVEPRLTASMILALLDGLLFQAATGLTDIGDPGLPDRISRIILEGVLR